MISGPREASVEEIVESLAFALRYEGRKRVDQADPTMAQIAAEHLRVWLEASGFVVMKRPTARRPARPEYRRAGEEA